MPGSHPSHHPRPHGVKLPTPRVLAPPTLKPPPASLNSLSPSDRLSLFCRVRSLLNFLSERIRSIFPLSRRLVNYMLHRLLSRGLWLVWQVLLSPSRGAWYS